MTKKCYIGGCVRNCSQHLVKVFQNIKEISKVFDEYKIIIAYDESSDNSLEILFYLKKKYEGIMDIEIILNDKILSQYRTFNIAKARNSIIEYIKNDNDPSFQYFIMMDMDDVCANLIDQPNILENYLLKDNWDSLSFNRNEYYDIWALSIEPYLFSCWHFADSTGPSNSVHEIRKYIIDLLNKIPKDELLSCHSAFNGFAIYKKEKFINCTYNADIIKNIELLGKDLIHVQEKAYNKRFFIRENCPEDCEHRYFHLEAIIKNNARIRISPLKLFH